MKKISLILTAFFVVLLSGFFACNSGKGPSKNKEGVVEITGPANQDSLVKNKNISPQPYPQFIP